MNSIKVEINRLANSRKRLTMNLDLVRRAMAPCIHDQKSEQFILLSSREDSLITAISRVDQALACLYDLREGGML